MFKRGTFANDVTSPMRLQVRYPGLTRRLIKAGVYSIRRLFNQPLEKQR